MTKRVAAVLAALGLCVVGCGILPESVQLITGPPDGSFGCYPEEVVGRLVVDPTHGTAIVVPAWGNGPTALGWPAGYTARRSGSEVEVLDPQGNVVATTGRSYQFHEGSQYPPGTSGRPPELPTNMTWACVPLQPAEPAPPTAPPTQDQIRQFAARDYARKVIQANRARNAVFQRYKNRTSLKDNKTYCWKLAYVERDFLVALRGIRYPDDAAADGRALFLDEAAQEAALRTCAKAPNVSALNRAIDLANKARDRAHEASHKVGLDLGLNSPAGLSQAGRSHDAAPATSISGG